MMWQFILDALNWLCTPQGVNLCFVLLCLAAAAGLGVRAVALISAALYLVLVVMG